MYDYFKDSIVVDDWEEVCRKNTDIENFYIQHGLKKESTLSIIDVVCGDKLDLIDHSKPIFFNPMGMAVFDIAIAEYYYSLAKTAKKGLSLV